MRAAEIGRRRILADIDDALADGARAREMLVQRLAVALADRLGQQRNILVEAAEHLQHRLLVGEEHVAPHGRIGRRDAGEIAEAAGGEFQHLRARHRLHFVGGADDGVGDQMRQMAGDGEHHVVVVGRHGLDIGAEQAPERGELFGRRRIGAWRRRQDAPAVDEQFGKARVRPGIFGAGDRVRGHEMHGLRQMRGHVAYHRALDRADVGDDRAFRKMRADLLGDRAADADRNAEDDEVGAFHRRGVGLDHLVGDAEFGDAPARLRRTRGGDDRAHRALRLGGARDRGADQSDTDQRETVEESRRCCHVILPQAKRSPSPACGGGLGRGNARAALGGMPPPDALRASTSPASGRGKECLLLAWCITPTSPRNP